MNEEPVLLNEFEYKGVKTRQYLYGNVWVEIENTGVKTEEEIEKELQERIQNIPEERILGISPEMEDEVIP